MTVYYEINTSRGQDRAPALCPTGKNEKQSRDNAVATRPKLDTGAHRLPAPRPAEQIERRAQRSGRAGKGFPWRREPKLRCGKTIDLNTGHGKPWAPYMTTGCKQLLVEKTVVGKSVQNREPCGNENRKSNARLQTGAETENKNLRIKSLIK
jgi:hypothetical protein